MRPGEAEGGSAGTRLPESRAGNNPGRRVPCPAMALRSPKDTAPRGKRWYRSHEQANLRRDPPGLVPLRTWASHPIVSRRANRAATLIPRCRPELDDQLGRHPAAVLYLDTLRLSPFTNLRGVQSAGRGPAPGPRGPARSGAAAPPRGLDVTRQRLAQRLGVLGVQVDLVLRAIQRKADRTLCLTTIDVIDEQGLYLLSHVYSVPLVE